MKKALTSCITKGTFLVHDKWLATEKAVKDLAKACKSRCERRAYPTQARDKPLLAFIYALTCASWTLTFALAFRSAFALLAASASFFLSCAPENALFGSEPRHE